MYKWVGIVMATVVMAGCSMTKKNVGEANVGMQDWYSKEDSLRKAYSDCMKKNGKDSPKCQKQKSDLYNQMEWNLLEQSD